MYITNISLRNFKNYEDFFLEFNPRGAIIIGQNGIGKTNLLEAISYFSYGKSVLNIPDECLIRYHQEICTVKASYHFNGRNWDFKAYFDKSSKKHISIENKSLKKMSELYHYLQIVYSGPNDLYNLFSTPAKRRLFIDSSISKLYPDYLIHLTKYKYIHFQRNAMLKNNYQPKEKEAWDKVFCEENNNIVQYRINFFKILRLYYQAAYQKITVEEERVDIHLKPNFYCEDFSIPPLVTRLRENEEKEKKNQCSLFGCHLDDFYLTINNNIASLFASQGQKRSMVIALKLALAQIISEISQNDPILIFDDTLAELDQQRNKNLLTYLTTKHQIFIASPSFAKYSSIELPVIDLHRFHEKN